MGKSKGTRITVTLECLCENTSGQLANRNRTFRYTTTKNRRNTPNKLRLKKYCPKCNRHNFFQEIK